MIKSALRRLRVRSSRQYLEKFVRDAGNSVPHGAYVLDAGAGDAPYRKFFSHTHYETADFCEVDKPYYSDITYVCDLRSVPAQSGRYDMILLTQVLEHCPEPKDVLQEMCRLLKPGEKCGYRRRCSMKNTRHLMIFFAIPNLDFDICLNKPAFLFYL